MTPDTELRRQVSAMLEERLHLRVESADTDLIETGAMDSLLLVELLLQLEDVFGFKVEFEDLELEQLRSVDSIAELVAAHAPRSSPAVSFPR